MSDAADAGAVDLGAYLARTGAERPALPGPEALAELHLAHALAIPFENADIQLGLGVRVDLASIQDKLVARRRGGYCFEQNGLFGAVLERLGYRVTRLGARVRVGGSPQPPRTHVLLAVEAGGRPWLCDVGFGAEGLYRPLPLEPGEHELGPDRYRLAEEAGGATVLSLWQGGAWLPLYAFTPEPFLPVDVEVANWFTSTHPQSRFVLTLTAQRLMADGERRTLRNRDVTIRRGDRLERRTITSPEQLLAILADDFGLAFPPGTRFAQPAF